MLDCWKFEPNARPSFSKVVCSLSRFLETMVGYMDVTDLEKHQKISGVEKRSSEGSVHADEGILICDTTKTAV